MSNRNTKHTPGPRFTVYQNPNMIHLFSVLDHKAGGYLVRDVPESTARLIAAAPELLEALIHVEQWSRMDDRMSKREAMDKVLKAIAKAAGGAS